MVRFCQGAGAFLIPTGLWRSTFSDFSSLAAPAEATADDGFHLQPHYRSARPLDATLLKVTAGLDEFITEKYAEQIAAILATWTAGMLQSPRETRAISKVLAPDFFGASLQPVQSRAVRSNASLHVSNNSFSTELSLGRDAFLREWQQSISRFLKDRNRRVPGCDD